MAETIDGLFATIDGWRDGVQSHLEADAAPPRPRRWIRSSKRTAVPALAAAASSPAAASWPRRACCRMPTGIWRGGWADRPASVASPRSTTPDNEQFRDYTTLEWWRVPARTGARHLTGPYVDYVCTDDYTVTITTPVTVGGQILGVVGMDVLVDRLERELLPLLRAAGVPIAVVNASGRIVTSTDSRREPGSMLRLEGLDDALAPLRAPEPPSGSRRLPGGAEVIACGDTSLALVVGI